MFIYQFMNYEICPCQEALAIADNEEEALMMIKAQTNIDNGWELVNKFEYKKGYLFHGDADC